MAKVMARRRSDSVHIYVVESRGCYTSTHADIKDTLAYRARMRSLKCRECSRWAIFGEDRLDLLEVAKAEAGHVLLVDEVNVVLTTPRVDAVLDRFYNGKGRRAIELPVATRKLPRPFTAWCLPKPLHIQTISFDGPVEHVCSLCGSLRFSLTRTDSHIFVPRLRLRPVMQEHAFLHVTEEVKLALQAAKIPGLIFRKYPVVHEAHLKHVDGSTIVLR
jgi:hypothetical protein